MDDILKTIGERLKFYIQEKGYPTIEKFAYENGFEKSAIGKIVKGKRAPQIDTLIRVTEALEITVNDLYLRKDSKKAS